MLTLRIWAISRKMLKFLKGFYVSLMSLHLTTFCFKRFKQKNFEFFSKSRYVDISYTILLRSCYSQLLNSQKKLRTNENKIWILFANLSQELLGTNSRIENHLFRQKMFTSNIFSRLTNLLIVVRTKFIL